MWLIPEADNGVNGATRGAGQVTVPPVVHGLRVEHLKLPGFRLVQQRLTVPPAIDVAGTLDKEWRRLCESVRLTPGAEVAVAVGSRGIDRLSEIVGDVVGKLQAAGCRPFILPAMGSHGGGSAEGQLSTLAELGVTEERVGARFAPPWMSFELA